MTFGNFHFRLGPTACFCVALFWFPAILSAQSNFTGFIEPDVSVNYKVARNYDHNFKLSTRTFFYDDDAYAIRSRQIDVAHFSKLKLTDDQSLALGVQYRFRKAFESDRENELRVTQQYNLTFKPNVVRFGQRFRSEQRIQTSRTVHRFRYRFAVDFPLQGEQLDVGETYLVTATEALLSVTRNAGPQYDQRFHLDLGILIDSGIRIQTGIAYRLEDYTNETENIMFINASLILRL